MEIYYYNSIVVNLVHVKLVNKQFAIKTLNLIVLEQFLFFMRQIIRHQVLLYIYSMG